MLDNALTATLHLRKDYWRTSNTSADVRSCPVRGTCMGNPDAPEAGYCANGLDPRVPYCSRCLSYPDKYREGASCKSCSGARVAFLGYASALVIVLLGARLFASHAPDAWQHRAALAAWFLRLAAWWSSLAAKGKQSLGFYQIITHLHQVFGVVLPPSFQELQHRLGIFNLDIFALPGLHMACFGFNTFTSQLLLRAAVPLLLVLAAVGYHWSRHQLADALPFTLWITFLVFSLVSSPAFQAFNCEAFDDGRYAQRGLNQRLPG